VLTEALMTAGHDYAGGVYVVGLQPQARGVPDVTTIRSHTTQGDFRFASTDGQHRGVVLGKLLALRFNKWAGTASTFSRRAAQDEPGHGWFRSEGRDVRSHRNRLDGMYEYDNSYAFVALDKAQTLADLGGGVTGIEVKTADRWQAATVASRLVSALGWPYRTWIGKNRIILSSGAQA